MERRKYLSSSFVACTSLILGGCTQLGTKSRSESESESESVPELNDLTISNKTNNSEKATIKVTYEADQEVILEETRVIPPEGEFSFEDPINNSGTHHIYVEVENGPNGEYNWDVWGHSGGQDEAHALGIYIHNKEIEFGETAV